MSDDHAFASFDDLKVELEIVAVVVGLAFDQAEAPPT